MSRHMTTSSPPLVRQFDSLARQLPCTDRWSVIVLRVLRLSSIIKPAYSTITYSSFKRVHNVSLSDYEGYVLAVEKKVHNTVIECSSKCQTDCLSYSYNKETKVCKTYTKAMCDGHNVNLSSATEYTKMTDEAASLTSCSKLCPANSSGVYRVTLTPGRNDDVYCDMDTDGGPWTVIQNRQDGTVDFYRNWTEYQTGFGDLDGEFWAGLNMIHLLTQNGSILRINLMSWKNDSRYAQYQDFRVGDVSSEYRLSISGFSGNVFADEMAYRNGYKFSTYDNDNDSKMSGKCAVRHHGAWWYGSCSDSNLNGRYVQDTGDDLQSMYWYTFYSDRSYVPMMKSRMMVKHPGL
ncbi:fibrinogen-like protein A [Argopecten irradians]|uniref:fibrinogen-like protein A n=1 Tax=Argopecten irradians TaxID=31199 RepID=UPI0037170AD2